MKILVTGGAGFIGSQIVDLLVARGDSVVIIDNLSTGRESYLNQKATFYKSDIREKIDWIFEKEKPEAVIHAAAHVLLRKSIEDPMNDASINILGSINVLEACRKNGVKKIIYTSTSARVGEPEYIPVDEEHPINPTSPYGISKHSAEHYFWAYNKLYGLDYLIFCFGNVYGPRDDPKAGRVTGIFIDKMLRGESPKIFGDGLQTRDFIYVRDLAEFIVQCIPKKPEHKIFHLANGIQISVKEVFDTLKRLTGFKGDAEHIQAINGEIRDICFDIKRVKEELGWNPKNNYQAGAEETVAWFKENYKF